LESNTLNAELDNSGGLNAAYAASAIYSPAFYPASGVP